MQNGGAELNFVYRGEEPFSFGNGTVLGAGTIETALPFAGTVVVEPDAAGAALHAGFTAGGVRGVRALTTVLESVVVLLPGAVVVALVVLLAAAEVVLWLEFLLWLLPPPRVAKKAIRTKTTTTAAPIPPRR